MAWSSCEACFLPGLMLCSSSSTNSKHQKGMHNRNLLTHPNNLILMGMRTHASHPQAPFTPLCPLLFAFAQVVPTAAAMS